MRYEYNDGKKTKIVELVRESDKFLTMRCKDENGLFIEFRKKKPIDLTPLPDYDGERPVFDYWITEPFQHQIDSLKYAEENDCFLNRDKPGLGKTKQSLDLIMNRRRCGQIQRTLVVCCEGGLQFNWLREVKKHTDLKGYILGTRPVRKNSISTCIGSNNDKLKDLKTVRSEILICNLEMLRVDAIVTQLQLMIAKGDIGMVVVDEVHKAKNTGAKQTSNLFKLHPRYKLALTGTVIINSPLDIYGLACWLGKELRAPSRFKDTYCVYGGYKNREIVSFQNLDKLADELNSWSIMRTKEQCLDLPEKITKTVYIELTEKQKTLYREVQKDVRDRKEEILASPTPMGRFVALRKVTGCPRDLLPDFQIEDCSKVLVMLELIEQAFANGEKVIVFTWHIPTLMFINDVLYSRGITPAIMYGDISQEDRDRNKEAFQNNPDCKIIIGNYQTMGTGHDLYAGSCVIEYEQPWTAADENQAQDRAHRIGVTKTVTCIRLVGRNTVDERVCDIVDSKRDLSNAVENKKFIADMVEKTLNMQI